MTSTTESLTISSTASTECMYKTSDTTLWVERALPGDLGALVRLEGASFTADAFSRRQLRYLAFYAQGRCLVARGEEGVAGYISLLWRTGCRNLRIYSVAVDPMFRGRGVGRQLLDAAAAYARELGLDTLSLEVHTTNRAALALYESYGFRQTALLKDYYGAGADGLRMGCPVV